MGRTVRFEFRKLFRSKSFYICLGVLLAIGLLSVLTTYFTMKLIYDNVGGEPGQMNDLFGYLSGRYFLLNAVTGSGMRMMLGIFLALFICQDYSDGAVKNIIGRGHTRTDWVGSKLVVAAAETLIYSLAQMGLSYLTGTVLWTSGTLAAGDLAILGRQLLIMLAYAAIFSFVSFAIRKAGGAVAVNLIADTVIVLVVDLIEILVNKDNFTPSRFLLATNLSNTAPEWSGSLLLLTGQDTNLIVPVALVYLAVFTALCFLVTGKRDV